MGYTTEFTGEFKLNKPLDAATLEFLVKFNETRRMARSSAKLKKEFGKDFGIEGEFFVDGDGFHGQGGGGHVLDHNKPPRTQPSLWCQWRPNEAGTAIVWDGGEKFYSYVEWLQYLITNVLGPKGYSLTGDVTWSDEEQGDIGVISVKNNVIETFAGTHISPKDKTVLLEDGKIEYETCVHPVNGRKYVDAKSFGKAVRQMKKAGMSIDHVLAALKISEEKA